MKMVEVRRKAKVMGIRPGKLNKAELIQIIQKNEGNLPCFGSSSGRCEQGGCCFRNDCLELL